MMASHILMSRLYDSGTSTRRGYFCRISTSSLDVETSKNLYPPSPEKNPEVCASSSDGLLCLQYSDRDTRTCTYIVWNPSSNEFKSVPDCLEPTSPCPEARTSYDHRERGCSASTSAIQACGLGFDQKSNDYKFIQFRSIDYTENDERGYCHSRVLQIAVYSLKNNSWKDITSASWNEAFPDDDNPGFRFFDATDVSGRLYWIVDVGIISFDLGDEEFSPLPFPDELIMGISRSSLMEIHGALALVNYRRLGVDSLFEFCVWEKETETWTTKTCYEFCASQVDWPMGFCRNYQLFLLRGLDGKLLAYDYTLRELKKIHQIYDYPGTNYPGVCVGRNSAPRSSSLKKLFPYVEKTMADIYM